MDWGPKPFWFINAWMEHLEKLVGWTGFVVKEKLKKLKEDLKEWNQNVFGIVEANIEKSRREIQKLDAIDDTLG